MAFSYYHRLSASQKRIYQESDRVTSIFLPEIEPLKPLVRALRKALQTESRMQTEESSLSLLRSLNGFLGVPPVRVRVLVKRPSKDWGELHGLYEATNDGRTPIITVWMRTAHRRQVVAFKTFLRTLLHELGHHLDYEYLHLKDSLHTEGFYKRESSLLHQLWEEDNPTPNN